MASSLTSRPRRRSPRCSCFTIGLSTFGSLGPALLAGLHEEVHACRECGRLSLVVHFPMSFTCCCATKETKAKNHRIQASRCKTEKVPLHCSLTFLVHSLVKMNSRTRREARFSIDEGEERRRHILTRGLVLYGGQGYHIFFLRRILQSISMHLQVDILTSSMVFGSVGGIRTSPNCRNGWSNKESHVVISTLSGAATSAFACGCCIDVDCSQNVRGRFRNTSPSFTWQKNVVPTAGQRWCWADLCELLQIAGKSIVVQRSRLGVGRDFTLDIRGERVGITRIVPE